jgi:hypothetical protein
MQNIIAFGHRSCKLQAKEDWYVEKYSKPISAGSADFEGKFGPENRGLSFLCDKAGTGKPSAKR